MKVRVFDIESFALQLRMTRAARQVTLRQLESMSGVSYAFLSQIANHHHIPAIDTIIWLCDWMEQDLSDFIICQQV